MNELRVDPTDHDFIEIFSEIIKVDIKTSIRAFFVVVMLVTKVICPFGREKRPLTFPDVFVSPWATQF